MVFMKNNKGKSLKKLKENLNESLKDNDVTSSLKITETIMNMYPKNIFGYENYIKIKTDNYNKYINDEELKEVKKIYELGYDVCTKNEKISFKKEFDNYLYDIKEVENLKKIKKEIVSKYVISNIFSSALSICNQNLNLSKLYNEYGIKLKSIYDIINAVFLLLCMIFNIIYSNILLVITIPFGIFGIISIYSFIEINFLKKGKRKIEKEEYQAILNNEKEKVVDIKNELEKCIDAISFLEEQKKSSINKLPGAFSSNIMAIINEDEKQIAQNIYNSLEANNLALFYSLLEKHTSLDAEDVNNIIENFSSKNSLLSNFINNKSTEKKNKQNKVIYMKKISITNIIFLIISIVVNIICILAMVNKQINISFVPFVFGTIIGIFRVFLYNIDAGKHETVYETFKDNLISTIFTSSLTYNLIYGYYGNSIKFVYNFIKIPIIYLIIFIGFVMFISILKYNYLLKKLRS